MGNSKAKHVKKKRYTYPQDQLDCIKILLIGDPQVGKTALRMRYCDNVYDQLNQDSIFSKKDIGTQLCMQVWEYRNKDILNISLPDTKKFDGVIVVFDLSRLETFKNADRWLAVVRETNTMPTIMVGNKSDLAEEQQVSFEEVVEYAKSRDILYSETSAKMDINVKDVFLNFAKDIVVNKRDM